MKKKLDQNFYKIFLDHLPDPILAVEKKNFLIKFINHESEIFFSKSNSLLENKNLNQVFHKNSYLLSYLKKIVDEVGEYFIKEIPIKYSDPVEVKCIIPDKNIDFCFTIVGAHMCPGRLLVLLVTLHIYASTSDKLMASMSFGGITKAPYVPNFTLLSTIIYNTTSSSNHIYIRFTI